MTRSSRLRYRGFAQHILSALGLSALGILPGVAGTACTTSVFVEGPGDGSGGGSTTASTGNATASSGSGTVPFVCETEVPPGFELLYACIDNQGDSCPDREDPELLPELYEPVHEAGCSTPENGCCMVETVSAPCGPDHTVNDACCYYVLYKAELICAGRPFVVEGEAQTATLQGGDDWSAVLRPSREGLSAEQREGLREAWLADALDEHASVAAFARFSLQLLQLGAPPELLYMAQRATRDEIMHAELCFGLANGYGDEPVGPGPLQVEHALSADCDPEALVLATLREGCFGETAAAMVASEATERCQDPVVRKVLDKIVRDESNHAEFAWRFVGWMLDRYPELREPVARAVSEIAAQYQEAPASVGAMSWSAPFGQLDARERAWVNARTAREVFLPCAYAMLRAGEREARTSTVRVA